MGAHEHGWDFALGGQGWAARCRCGLEVIVDELECGRSIWAWTLAGGTPPEALVLDGMGSVKHALRALLAEPARGARN